MQALMSLFVLASRDGWVNIMYTGLDAVGVDQQVTITTLNQSINQSILFAQNVQRYTYKAIQLRAGQQG